MIITIEQPERREKSSRKKLLQQHSFYSAKKRTKATRVRYINHHESPRFYGPG
jgi:hypothetical protein